MTATTAPTSQLLQLRPGAYYRTRDGRRVGPMKLYGDSSLPGSEFSAIIEVGSFQGERLWHPSGRHIFGEDCLTLVAEWTDTPATNTPVRTVTTTRTEIRPGDYGLINVKFQVSGDLRVDLTTYNPSAEELRAAAATLTELAEGLDKIEAEKDAK